MTAAGAEISEHGFSTLEADSAMVEVPDSRLNVLAEHIETLKVIPATVKVVDIAGLTKGSASGKGLGNRFLGALKECDALLHVVRCFDNPRVHRDEPLNPEGDLETVELELVLADLETVQRNVERVAKKARLGDRELQAELVALEDVARGEELCSAYLDPLQPLAARRAAWCRPPVGLKAWRSSPRITFRTHSSVAQRGRPARKVP